MGGTCCAACCSEREGTPWRRLLMVALLFYSGVPFAAARLSCRQAIEASDLNHDRLLNRYPEYVTYLNRMSQNAVPSVTLGFEELPLVLRENYEVFVNDNNGQINMSDAAIGTKLEDFVDVFCESTKNSIEAVLLPTMSPHFRWGSPRRTTGWIEDRIATESPEPTDSGSFQLQQLTGTSQSQPEYTQNLFSDESTASRRIPTRLRRESSPSVQNPQTTSRKDRRLRSDECATFVGFSDLDGDGSLMPKEYILLASLLGDTEIVSEFSELPQSLQDSFYELAVGNKIIISSPTENVPPRRLGNIFQKRDKQGAVTLDEVCEKTRNAIFLSSAIGYPTISPSGGYPSENSFLTMSEYMNDRTSGSRSPTFTPTGLDDADRSMSSTENAQADSAAAVTLFSAQTFEKNISLESLGTPLPQAVSLTQAGIPSTRTASNSPSSDLNVTDQNATTTLGSPSPSTAPPTLPVGATLKGNTNMLEVYNSWIMENSLALTAKDLLSSPFYNGLTNAYDSFVNDVISAMIASRSGQGRLRRRRLAVSLEPETPSIYEVVDSQCPTLAPTSQAPSSSNVNCVKVFAKASLLIDQVEVSDSVKNEYLSLSQARIDQGVLQEDINEGSPGALWVVVGSSFPLVPNSGDSSNAGNTGGTGNNLGLEDGLIISAAVCVALVVLICLFVVLPEKRRQRRIADARKQALVDLREAEALDQVIPVNKLRQRTKVSGPKKKHNEKMNPWRIKVARCIDQFCPERKKDLDSLLHQFKGREQELIALLKDTRHGESMLEEEFLDESVSVSDWENDSFDSFANLEQHADDLADGDIAGFSDAGSARGSQSDWESEASSDPLVVRREEILHHSIGSDGLEPPGAAGRAADPKEPPGVSGSIEFSNDDESFKTEMDDGDESFLSENSAEMQATGEKQRLEQEEAENAATEETDRLWRIAAQEETSRKRADDARKRAEEEKKRAENDSKADLEARIAAEVEARIAAEVEARLREEAASRRSEPEIPKLAAHSVMYRKETKTTKTEATTDDDTAQETMDSEWVESDESKDIYRIHWFRSNGYWKAKKVPVVHDDESSVEYYSDDESQSMMQNSWRWVKRGNQWAQEYIAGSACDSDESYESGSDSDEDDGMNWAKRDGKWVRIPVGEGVESLSLSYSTDDTAFV